MHFIPSFSAETLTLLTVVVTLILMTKSWFLGTVLSYRKGFHNFDMECYNKYGSFWGIYDGRQPVLMVTDREIIKTIMVKECYTLFTNRREMKMAGQIADAVAHVKDEKWRRIRSVLSPFFTSGRLKEVFPIVSRYANRLVCSLNKRNLEDSLEIKDVFGPYSLDVVSSASFSVDIDSINNPNDAIVAHIKKMMKVNLLNPLLLIIIIFPFTARLFGKLGFSLFSKSSVKFLYDALKKIKDQHSTAHGTRVDFLQLMIKSKISEEQANIKENEECVKGLTDHEILSQSLNFIVAGYETTSSALTFLAYNLATNPEALKKLQEEIDRVFPHNAPITYEPLMQMEYLDMVINESMRLWPPTPRIERACKKTVEIKGLTIPTGTLVAVPTYVLHRDPKLWESPETFKPERFSKDNKDGFDQYAFLPFGTGPRNCIGIKFALMIMKAAMVKLLQNFDLETCKDTQIPLELDALIRPKKPIKLKLVPRTPHENED